MKLVVTLPLLAALVKRASGAGEGQWFSYFEKGGLGPSRWALLRTPENQCGGGLTPDDVSGVDGIFTGEKWSDYGQSPVAVKWEDCQGTFDYEFESGDCTFEQLEYSISNNGVKVQPIATADGTADCTFSRMGIPHFPAKDGARQMFKGLQFHIHTSSEHTLSTRRATSDNDSGYFPAELHIVHAAEDEDGNAVMPYAVWGAFIEQKSPCDESEPGCLHETFESFLIGWEKAAQDVESYCAATIGGEGRRLTADATAQPSIEGLDFGRVLAGSSINTFKPATDVNGVTTGQDGCYNKGAGGNSWPARDPILESTATPNLYTDLITHKGDYGSFTYKGGLTTPPCTQIVNWNLMDEPIKISAGQLQRLQRLIWCYVEKDPTCNHATSANVAGSTSRPPLPITSERKVIHRCPASSGCAGKNCTAMVDKVTPQKDGIEFQKPDPKPEDPNTKEGQCNKAWTKGCPVDKRANPNVSPNLKANAPVWNDFEGFWVGRFSATDRNGVPLTENFMNPNLTEEIPYDRSTVTMLVNRTIIEAQYYEHIYYVYAPADSTANSKRTGVDFCTLPKLVGSKNVQDSKGSMSECGKTGWAFYAERFGAATHEKDGTASLFKATGRYKNATEGDAVPVGSNSIYVSMRGAEMKQTETLTFLNDNRTKIGGSGQLYLFKNFEPYLTDPHEETFTYFLDQVSEATFKIRLNTAYDVNNVKYYDQIRTYGCLDGEACPTSSEWSAVDPTSSQNPSPYDEGASASGWFIAVMVILCVGVLVILAYWWHTVQIQKQKDRISRQFARRVAETIKVEGAHNQLSAEALEEEFKRIDTDHSGYLSKSELKAFVNSGKIGTMTDSDFNALFAALDVDGNGTVDFTEFCAFMAQCGQVYDEEEKGLSPDERRRSIAKRMSSRGFKDAEVPFTEKDEPAEGGKEENFNDE